MKVTLNSYELRELLLSDAEIRNDKSFLKGKSFNDVFEVKLQPQIKQEDGSFKPNLGATILLSEEDQDAEIGFSDLSNYEDYLEFKEVIRE